MFFKMGTLNNFAIKHGCFPVEKQPLGGVLATRCSFLLADVNILIDFPGLEEQFKMLG